ncbi:MAG: arginine repressor [Clostridia bacterium]|nr:arginine repressor [Clostridia bacterium]
MKSQRQSAIIELIERFEIETQEDMISRLRALGYEVTQATVSRDIRELKLTKVPTTHGTYRYVKNRTNHHEGNIKLNHAVVDSITKVDYAANVVVLKTYPGLAMAVASGVDALNLEGVLGCIGGDDTIIIVTRNEDVSASISENIKDLIKGI